MDFRRSRVFTPFDQAARAVEQRVHNDNCLRPHRSYGYLTRAAAHASSEPLRKHWKPKGYKAAQPSIATDTA